MVDMKKFETILQDYVYIKECCAVLNECEELGFDESIYDFEEYRDDLVRIANKHDISVFKINDDYDIDELKEYVVFLENKLINELLYQIKYLYQYK